MTKYMFYPGCSLEKNASAYLDSLKAIQDIIEIELQEVPDWNCCGATEYKSVYRLASDALVGRNLALAQANANGTNTLMAACSACYLNLEKTDHYMSEDKKLSADVNEALAAGGLSYDPGSIEIRHLLDIIINDVGCERVKELVTQPLKGLKVAAYYGCQIVRPDVNNRWGNSEDPKVLEELMEALGAEIVHFPMKTKCCSGHLTQISRESAFTMIDEIISGADRYEADVIVTLCPMCQLNLDAYQDDTRKFFGKEYGIPVLYFTQLMGLAFGVDMKKLGFGKEFVNPFKALNKIGQEPQEDQAGKKKIMDEGLPTPQLVGKNGGES